jgi:hypothetical protein
MQPLFYNSNFLPCIIKNNMLALLLILCGGIKLTPSNLELWNFMVIVFGSYVSVVCAILCNKCGGDVRFKFIFLLESNNESLYLNKWN